ncbi:hypothetical protein ACLKA7_007054 [Drosophila subpalustris]
MTTADKLQASNCSLQDYKPKPGCEQIYTRTRARSQKTNQQPATSHIVCMGWKTKALAVSEAQDPDTDVQCDPGDLAGSPSSQKQNVCESAQSA